MCIRDSRCLERAARRGAGLDHDAQLHAACGGLARRLRQDVRAPGEEVAMRLNGKVALVSGAANGMGQSEALIFAREGAKVAVADLLETEGRQVADKIKAAGGQAIFIKLDVGNEAEWEKAIKATVDAFGKLDVLVNNAGISGTFDPDTLSTSAWDKLMEINAKGVFLGMKTGIAAMQK